MARIWPHAIERPANARLPQQAAQDIYLAGSVLSNEIQSVFDHKGFGV
jgi:hypothetical protein